MQDRFAQAATDRTASTDHRAGAAAPTTRVRPVQVKFRPPVTWTERVVAAAYADVLGLPADHIGLNDDFFALGGNSVSAARVVRLLGEALDADVAVPAIFADPTVAGLAERIAGSTAGSP